MIVIDGYDQLGWLERRRVLRSCRQAQMGLLVTAHWPVHLPTLIRLAPDKALIKELVSTLTARIATPITDEHVAASHACHASNVREILFDLYDQHECLRRFERTSTDHHA
jgi:hypothetical protein